MKAEFERGSFPRGMDVGACQPISPSHAPAHVCCPRDTYEAGTNTEAATSVFSGRNYVCLWTDAIRLKWKPSSKDACGSRNYLVMIVEYSWFMMLKAAGVIPLQDALQFVSASVPLDTLSVSISVLTMRGTQTEVAQFSLELMGWSEFAIFIRCIIFNWAQALCLWLQT